MNKMSLPLVLKISESFLQSIAQIILSATILAVIIFCSFLGLSACCVPSFVRADFLILDAVKPGEAIFIDINGKLHAQLCCENTGYSPCIFEFVYFARPDTILDGISVYSARMKMGHSLGKKISSEWANHDIDVVMPIPDTS